jgi:hypothetical protein
MIAMGSWECYWADAIRSGDEQAQQRAHAELSSLFANHVVIAPAGAPKTGSHRPSFPVVAFADDGGYQYKQQITPTRRRPRPKCSSRAAGRTARSARKPGVTLLDQACISAACREQLRAQAMPAGSR